MGKCQIDIEAKARRVLDDYMARRFSGDRGRPIQTRLEATGGELEAIKCYLAGMTIAATVQYLRAERDIFVSRSVVGRLFRDLFIHQVYRLRAV